MHRNIISLNYRAPFFVLSRVPLSFPRRRESRPSVIILWIPAGVYPREDGGGNDRKKRLIKKVL